MGEANSPTETAILNALRELDRAVAALPMESTTPNLLPLFSRIDELTAALPATTDPTLLHYLRKKSYEKAKLYLMGRDEDNQAGNCGHVH